jgi:hydrogenase maturation protease
VKVVVVGVGNAVRGDDAAGLAVAGRVRERGPDGVAVVECEQEPTRLLDAWDGADLALVVDASLSGAEPGTVHRFDATVDPVPARVFRSSTHAFGIGDAVELGRALGRLPARVVVYGIEGADFGLGSGVSDPVARAVEEVAGAVLAELEEAGCTSAP